MDKDEREATVPPDTAAGVDIDLTLSLDTVFEVLANQRRRFALYTLTDAPNGVVDLDALFEDVVTLEAALADEALTRDHYVDAAADLYHWHLPVLADVGLVDRDDRSGTIRYRGQSMLETWLDRVRDDELPDTRDRAQQ